MVAGQHINGEDIFSGKRIPFIAPLTIEYDYRKSVFGVCAEIAIGKQDQDEQRRL